MPDRKSTVTSKIRGKKYICVVELANVRSGPTMEAPVVGRVGQGTVVEVIGKKGKWARMIYQGKKSAWIYSDLLRPQ